MTEGRESQPTVDELRRVATRHNVPLAVAVITVDSVRDEDSIALRRVLESAVRGTDGVYQLAGGEYVVLAVVDAAAGADAIFARLHDVLPSELPFTLDYTCLDGDDLQLLHLG